MLSTRPSDLPDFERPPVREVAISAQFEPLIGFRQAHIGYFWSKVRSSFPATQDHELLPTHIESPENSNLSINFQIELSTSPILNRAWFISEDQSRVLQIQNDRFVYNWRYKKDKYPYFEDILDSFVSEYDTFCLALQEINLSQPKLNHVEVTYVNKIDSKSLDGFLMVVSPAPLNFGGVVANKALGQIGVRFPVESEGVDIGRLYVNCVPGPRVDGQSHSYQMSLTFRAPLAEPKVEILKTRLLQGRSAIVHTFTDLTDPSYHSKWGRIK